MKHCIAALFLVCLAAAAAAQDNTLYLRGGVVAIEQHAFASGVVRWYATIRTAAADLQVECATGPAKTACSSDGDPGSAFVPYLLYTGGCYPVFAASSSGDPLISAWVCGGSGTGHCRIATGHVELPADRADLLAGVATSLLSCY